jgi:hypothetical protein
MEELFGLGLHSGIVVSISFGGLSLDTLDKLQAARCDGQSETAYMKINFHEVVRSFGSFVGV